MDVARIRYLTIESETDKAYLALLPSSTEPMWFPKSQITMHSTMSNYFEIPLWLAKAKGISEYTLTPKELKPLGLQHTVAPIWVCDKCRTSVISSIQPQCWPCRERMSKTTEEEVEKWSKRQSRRSRSASRQRRA